MNLGANSDPNEALVEGIIERFAARLAAEFRYKTSAVTPGSAGAEIEIKLIPEFLFSDERNGLLVVAAGRGSLTWDGAAPMNAFKLISAGFRPMALASELSHILNLVVARRAAHAPRLIAAPIKENTHGNRA